VNSKWKARSFMRILGWVRGGALLGAAVSAAAARAFVAAMMLNVYGSRLGHSEAVGAD